MPHAHRLENVTRTLFQITRDPFLPWKHSESVLHEARRRGLETFVAVDDRTSPDDITRLTRLADTVVPFKSPGYCEAAYDLVSQVRTPFVLLISDDEVPSEGLWDFEPSIEARYGVPVVPIVNGQVYDLDFGIQERVFATKGWRWVGGFEGRSEGAPKAFLDRPGVAVWHYHLEAPRSVREAKARRYALLDPSTDHRTRVIWEEHPEALHPLQESICPDRGTFTP